MMEWNSTTQKGNMTINLFLWMLSSSKTQDSKGLRASYFAGTSEDTYKSKNAP